MNLANRITLLRVLLIPAIAIAIVYTSREKEFLRNIAFVLYVTACFSDALDGMIARLQRQITPLGVFLDPFADKLLLLVIFVFTYYSPWYESKVPAWVLILIVSRELFLASGLIILSMTERRIEISPHFIGKATTVAQMILAGGILLQSAWMNVFSYFVVVLTIVSGIFYICREIKR